MYTKLIITLLILSHVINDFYLQDDDMAIQKKTDLLVLTKHSALFFLSAFILTICFYSLKIFTCIVILTVLHFAIDELKIQCNIRYNKISKLSYFLFDQIAHFGVIFALIPLIDKVTINLSIRKILSIIFMNYPQLRSIDYNKYVYLVLVITFVLFIINAGTIITTLFFDLAQHLAVNNTDQQSNGVDLVQQQNTAMQQSAATTVTEQIQNTEQANTTQSGTLQQTISQVLEYKYGEVIGILERVIIFILIVSNHYEAIALVIAAKSIARFKQFEDNNFSDYYLVGTLSSSLVAIFAGIGFQVSCKLLNI